MHLNFLESLGVLMLFFFVSIIVVIAYYAIKDAINNWKKTYRKKCPFCGAYLHGYQYKHKGAKFAARFCSRCGRPLDGEENTFDQSSFAKEFKSLLWSSNEQRKITKRAWCEACMLYGKDCDGVSGNCDRAIIKEKKNDHD